MDDPPSGHGDGPASVSTAFSLQPPDLSNCTKQQIRDYFLNSYDLYETLFSSIKDESTYYKQPDKLRLQLVFYLGHTSAVYVNKLQLASALKDRPQRVMDAQFETGVDEMVWDTTDHCRLGGEFNWPRIPEVWQYRAEVKQTILDLIDAEPLELPLLHRDPWWALVLGIEHERIHFETSSVLIRQLPVDLVKAPQNWHYAPATTSGSDDSSLENKFIEVEETTAVLGKPDDFPSFGWDNEYGSLNFKVPAFAARQYLTSNREFLEFVQAGGYDNSAYWTEEGWKWRCKRQARHPTFWICSCGCKSGCEGELEDYSHCSEAAGAQPNVFRYRAMFDVIDMPWDWPAETNYHEARAFCKWLGDGHRVLTEAEFVVIRGKEDASAAVVDSDVIYRKDVADRFNLNMAFASSTPVDFYPSNSSGFCDTMGNVWQWMEDHFNGLPGAKYDYLYHDFSTPYYDGYHNTILGGSWISTGDSASSYARFWFRRHFFQHMGFRVVRSNNPPPAQLLSTPVYQPQMGFIDAKYPLPEFPEQPMIDSFTPEFRLESDSNILQQLCWDFGSSGKKITEELTFLGSISSDPNESRQLVTSVNNRALLHKAQQAQPSKSFWSRLAHIMEGAVNRIERCEDRALVIGCGTGRLAFTVAEFYQTVLGIHPVARCIDIAELIQKGDGLAGPALKNIPLTDLKVPKKSYPDVTFKQFLWVPLEMGQFDLVVLALLDVASCPEYWIARLSHIVTKNGVAMVVSTSWTPSKLQPVLEERGLKQLSFHQLQHDQAAVGAEVTGDSTPVTVSLWGHE